jgi:hypothetical protein
LLAVGFGTDLLCFEGGEEMAGNGEGAELVELFEKASKAADRAVADGEVVAAEEARCIEALKAMGTLPVSTSLLMSTQVHKPSLLPVFSLTLPQAVLRDGHWTRACTV